MDNLLQQMAPNQLAPQPSPNALSSAMPTNQLMNPPQAAANPLASQPVQPSPSQIQDAHEHLSEMQKSLLDLIKLPDSELNIKHILGAASDLVTKHRLTKGRKGVPALQIATELSSPGFPKEGDHPSDLRKFLQNQFDKTALLQATITHKVAAPAQQNTPQQS